MSYVLRRISQTIPLLLVVSVLVFLLIHAVPGGPLELYLENPNVRPADIERLRRELGLDRSLPQQYVSWLWSFVRGDWGYSYADGRPVLERLVERVPATLELVGMSTLFAIVISLVVGILSAVRRGVDRFTTLGTVAGISLPVFWFGLVLQLIFANALGWLPSSGRSSFGAADFSDRIAHLILPAIVLASAQAAGWTRYLRGSMRQALAMPFAGRRALTRRERDAHRASPCAAERAAAVRDRRSARCFDHGLGSGGHRKRLSRGPVWAGCSAKRWRSAITRCSWRS
jgi:peptide/nickel transport system permease protein